MQSSDYHRLDIYRINVGQGDAGIVTLSKVSNSGKQEKQKQIKFACMVDAGHQHRSNCNPYAKNLHRKLNFCLNQGRKNLDMIVISHLDSDHYKGLLPLLDRFALCSQLKKMTISLQSIFGLLSGPQVIASQSHMNPLSKLIEHLNKFGELMGMQQKLHMPRMRSETKDNFKNKRLEITSFIQKIVQPNIQFEGNICIDENTKIVAPRPANQTEETQCGQLKKLFKKIISNFSQFIYGDQLQNKKKLWRLYPVLQKHDILTFLPNPNISQNLSPSKSLTESQSQSYNQSDESLDQTMSKSLLSSQQKKQQSPTKSKESKAEKSKNSRSIINLFQFNSFTYLSCGDLPLSGLTKVIRQNFGSVEEQPSMVKPSSKSKTAKQSTLNLVTEQIKSDKRPRLHFLQCPHHGGKGHLSQQILQRCNPCAIIMSFGRNQSYKHPHHQTLLAAKHSGAIVYCHNNPFITNSNLNSLHFQNDRMVVLGEQYDNYDYQKHPLYLLSDLRIVIKDKKEKRSAKIKYMTKPQDQGFYLAWTDKFTFKLLNKSKKDSEQKTVTKKVSKTSILKGEKIKISINSFQNLKEQQNTNNLRIQFRKQGQYEVLQVFTADSQILLQKRRIQLKPETWLTRHCEAALQAFKKQQVLDEK